MVIMKNTIFKSSARRILVDIAVAVFLCLGFILLNRLINSAFTTQKTMSEDQNAIVVNDTIFGYDTKENAFVHGIIKPNQFLGDILQSGHVPFTEISTLEQKAKQVFDVRNIRPDRSYTMVFDTCFDKCKSFIYEPDPFKYVVYSFEDSVRAEVIERPFTLVTEAASGIIETSLWNAMMDQNLSPAVIDLMEDALASSVDFHHTQIGDVFKLIYEKKYIEGQPVALGKVLGAYWQNAQGESYGIYYENDKYKGYYDINGRPTKSTFLRAPVKYSRISSRYNLRRFHPIKRRTIPHLGTDYAAPYGTPIHSTADGVVVAASYTSNNGKYVKIKHNNTYQTQYLHMQRFAKGIRPGVKVNQGQTIGYIGSTGLATGPHVCYRFWKNGKQVDPLRENFAPADPMPEAELPKFFQSRDRIIEQLKLIPNPTKTLLATTLTTE